jgi:replicative DNA helicase
MSETTEKGLTLADLDEIDKAHTALQKAIACENANSTIGTVRDTDQARHLFRAKAAIHAPAFIGAVRAMRKVVMAANQSVIESYGTAPDAVLDALREFQAGPFARLLVSGEGEEDAK